MLLTFQRAMQSRSGCVAGVRLSPVTLAQLYCLYAWESPFVCGGNIELADFGVALWTCSQDCWPFSRFVEAINKGKPEKMLSRLGRRYDLRKFPADRDLLHQWIDWHCKVPSRFLKEDPNHKGASAPWPMIVAVQLMPMLGEERTWRLPVPLAMSYKIANDNAKGDTSWKSEEEEAQGYANGSDTQSDK